MTVADDEELPPTDELTIPKEMLPRLTAAQIRDEGYLLEVNRRFFHPLGLAMAVDVEANVISIIDDRSDPEGWYFASPFEEEDLAKIQNVREQTEARRGPRREALGYWIQPTGEVDYDVADDVR